jgi:hypothetical protein
MNLRRLVLSTIMALVLIVPFAPARADVLLTGGNRQDPCEQMRYRQDRMTKNLSDLVSVTDTARMDALSNARLVVDYANACARTYSFVLVDEVCDAELIEASAADVAVEIVKKYMGPDDELTLLDAVDRAYGAYVDASTSCKFINRPKILLDAIEAAEHKDFDYLFSLLKKR